MSPKRRQRPYANGSERGWVRVDYRPRGRGQQTRTAWAHPDRMPGLHAWLEEVTGAALAHFAPVFPATPSLAPASVPPAPEQPGPAVTEQPGLHPSVFGLRRVHPRGFATLDVESGLSVRMRAAPPLLLHREPGGWLTVKVLTGAHWPDPRAATAHSAGLLGPPR